jgi:outer membrane protein OmpA-like peptidoglycan-associated protein
MAETKNQNSLRSFVADYLKGPAPGGPQGQNAAILEQKPKSSNPEIPGMNTGKTQAIAGLTKDDYDEAEKIAKGVYNWVNKQGETKIIIVNRTSKVLNFVKGTDVLDKTDEAKWTRKAPPEIAAGAQDFMVVKTDMAIRGVTRANTSGSVVYEIAGKDEKDRTAKVRLAWTRKGDKGLDMKDDWQTDTMGFEVKPQQTADGEITFFVSEKALPTKPKDPQDAADTKSKGPLPPETFVLFDVGKSVLKAEAMSKIHEFGLAYVASKTAAKVYVMGYASIEGKDSDNTNLSFERAQAVFNHLTDADGGNLPKGSVHWDGGGPTTDFDSSNPKNYPPNRRVTIGFTPPKGKGAAPETEPNKQEPPPDPKGPVPQSRDNEEMPDRRSPSGVSNPHAV